MAQKHYIKQWRKDRKLTQQALADRMEFEPGVPLLSHATISNIESGKQSPTLDQLHAFAQALDVDVSALIEINPAVDGEVIDLLKRIPAKERPRLIAILKAAVGE